VVYRMSVEAESGASGWFWRTPRGKLATAAEGDGRTMSAYHCDLGRGDGANESKESRGRQGWDRPESGGIRQNLGNVWVGRLLLEGVVHCRRQTSAEAKIRGTGVLLNCCRGPAGVGAPVRRATSGQREKRSQDGGPWRHDRSALAILAISWKKLQWHSWLRIILG